MLHSSAAAVAPRLRSFRRLWITVLYGGAIFAGSLFGVYLAYENDLPQVSHLEDFQPNIITQVFAADGSLLGEFAIEKRVIVGFDDIPQVLRNAVVAVEDAEFWKHLGINPWRIPGAALANLRSGRKGQGFSTLTMQISRLLFLTPEKTYGRKLKEIILAFQIEKNFTKEEIFTLYCNQIYFGHGTYGVEAASRFFFNKSVKDVTLAEAALLAGVPQSPGRLSPVEHPEAARERRAHVLRRMLEEGHIAAEDAQRASAAPVSLRLNRDPPTIAPHYLEEVRKYLERRYGSQRIYQGGLRVYTTLDPRLQEIANGTVRRGLHRLDRKARGFVPTSESVLVDGVLPDPLHLPDWDRPIEVGDVVRGVVLDSDRHSAWVRLGTRHARVERQDVSWTRRRDVSGVLPRGSVAPFLVRGLSQEKSGRLMAQVTLEQEPLVQGALLCLDVRTGALTAMVGGYDFGRSKFNRATQALRQVGSAFKPILYAAALEAGDMSAATVIVDAPISFPDPWTKKIWAPHNYDFRFRGPLTLRRSLELSRNIPAVKTLQRVGIDTVVQYARKLGLSGELPPYLPIALGAGEATLLEMTSAFATFANQGLRMKPFLVSRVTDRDGNVLEETRPEAIDAIRADTAYLITSLLRGVVERGTATRARKLERPIAGKTGTTNDWTDGWFVGFEPALAAGVWVGFDEKKNSLGRRQDGSRTALPIWIDFWEQAVANTPVEEHPIPANIVFVPVDELGRPGRPGTPGVRMEAFVAGTEPKARWRTAAGRVLTRPSPP